MKAAVDLFVKICPLPLALVMLLLVSGLATGEVVTQQLESIADNMSAPEDVAVSLEGKVYALDAAAPGRLLVYDAFNQRLKTLAIDLPVAVAVGPGGYKYVATNKNFHVKILDSSDQVFNYLGNGYNEFVLPRNIAVDGATGRVYVVDQLGNSIKIYTAAGAFVKSIADPNNQPIDAVVWGNDLYVLDQPLVTDSSGGKIRGARVAVFDKTAGTPLRSFGTYGAAVGQLAKPRGIAVDSQGVVYISDSFHGVVQCFSTTGTYLGAVQNVKVGESMATPQGLAITGTGRLYVATKDSHDPPGLKVFQMNPPLTPGVDLQVSPISLEFGTIDLDAGSMARTITVTSNGTQNLVLGTVSLTGPGAGSFDVVTDDCSGRSLAGLATCTMEIVATPAAAGEQLAALAIPSNDPDTAIASLALSVTGVGIPAIAATPGTVDFGFVAIGEVSAAQGVTVTNSGSSALNITGVAVGGYAGSEFQIAANGCTGQPVAPAGTCALGLTFAPLIEGLRSANLIIQSNDPNRPNLAVALSGRGYGYQDIEVSPLALDFGVIPVQTMSANLPVTITNQGTIGLYVGKLAVQGPDAADFRISPNTCAERLLPAGETCEVNLTFSPASAEGGKAASLLIPSNDPDQGEILVSLTGMARITPVGGVDPKDDPKSRDRWIVVRIELPTGFAVDEIVLDSVVLDRVNGEAIDPPLHISGPVEVGDFNRNGIADLLVKFRRPELAGRLGPGESSITVSGELHDGTLFEQAGAVSNQE